METQKNKKNKYNISNFAREGKHRKIVSQGVDISLNELHCICRKIDTAKKENCSRCQQQYHECLIPKKEKHEQFQCLKCISRKIDPLYTVKKVFLETFIKTENIFENQNSISISFYVDIEDIKYPIQVRGLIIGKKILSWPMQGSFYINNQNTPIFEIKPLLINSNRKSRKQQYLTIPKQRIKIGKNVLTYRVPCLSDDFCSLYQSEKRGVYFIGIYSILKLSKGQLVSETIKNKQNRLEKDKSFKLLQQTFADDDLQIDGIKICLNCPYTGLRIRVPIRGKNCKHFSCVCLETLIQTHQRLRLWNCPVCKERINEPKVDIWILQILNDNQNGTEVKFSLSGTYQWVREQPSYDEIIDSNDEIQQNKNNKKTKNDQNRIQKIIQPQIKIFDTIECEPSSKNLKKNIPEGQQIIDLDDELIIPQNKQKNQEKNVKAKPKCDINVFNDIMKMRIFPPPEPQTVKQKLSENHQKFKNQLKKRPSQAKKRTALPIKDTQQKEKPIIFDIKIIQFKQITYSQFKNRYFKPIPKPKVPQQLKRIFKDIL